jgi:hypothetical protein
MMWGSPIRMHVALGLGVEPQFSPDGKCLAFSQPGGGGIALSFMELFFSWTQLKEEGGAVPCKWCVGRLRRTDARG